MLFEDPTDIREGCADVVRRVIVLRRKRSLSMPTVQFMKVKSPTLRELRPASERIGRALGFWPEGGREPRKA